MTNPRTMFEMDGPCPPVVVQSWLKWFWEDPNQIIEGKWVGCNVKDGLLKMIKDECKDLESTVHVLQRWGFEEDDAIELLKDLGRI